MESSPPPPSAMLTLPEDLLRLVVQWCGEGDATTLLTMGRVSLAFRRMVRERVAAVMHDTVMYLSAIGMRVQSERALHRIMVRRYVSLWSENRACIASW